MSDRSAKQFFFPNCFFITSVRRNISPCREMCLHLVGVVNGNEPQSCGLDVQMICVLNSYRFFFTSIFYFFPGAYSLVQCNGGLWSWEGGGGDLMRTLSLQLSRRVIQPSRVRFPSISVGVVGRGKNCKIKQMTKRWRLRAASWSVKQQWSYFSPGDDLFWARHPLQFSPDRRGSSWTVRGRLQEDK